MSKVSRDSKAFRSSAEFKAARELAAHHFEQLLAAESDPHHLWDENELSQYIIDHIMGPGATMVTVDAIGLWLAFIDNKQKPPVTAAVIRSFVVYLRRPLV